MNIQSILIILQKEIRDILRDRRTVISMILVPILIFPVIMVGSALFMKSRIEEIKEKESQVVWIAPDNTAYLKEAVTNLPGINVIDDTIDSSLAVEMIQEKEIEALIIVPEDFHSSLEEIVSGGSTVETPKVSVYLNQTRTQSDMAVAKIKAALQSFRANMTRETLQSRGLSPQMAEPFQMHSENIASAKEMGRFFASTFLPYILILMALTGAMYPAIDLTAGEKERGTLETLLVSGVSRVDIVLGKFLTVFMASVITAILSVGSMALTGTIALESFPEVASKLQFSLGLREVALMMMAMIPLAIIFSSILMAISVFAKSYREAQSYISPLMILVIFPAMASIMPDSETTSQGAFIPILNVSLMLKDSITGTIDPTVIMITMSVNILLSALTLAAVLRMFKQESVLFRV